MTKWLRHRHFLIGRYRRRKKKRALFLSSGRNQFQLRLSHLLEREERRRRATWHLVLHRFFQMESIPSGDHHYATLASWVGFWSSSRRQQETRAGPIDWQPAGDHDHPFIIDHGLQKKNTKVEKMFHPEQQLKRAIRLSFLHQPTQRIRLQRESLLSIASLGQSKDWKSWAKGSFAYWHKLEKGAPPRPLCWNEIFS